MASKTPFTDYAKKILKDAEVLDELLAKNNVPAPSFEDVNSPPELPYIPEVQELKMSLQDTLSDLHQLVSGPIEEYSVVMLPMIHVLGILNTFNQYDVWDAVPLEGSATYDEISRKVGLSARLLTRCFRLVMLKNVFAETSPGSGKVKHTSFSALFVKQPLWRAWIGHILEEGAPPTLQMARNLKKVGESTEPLDSASAKFFLKDKPDIKDLFEWMKVDGEDEGKKGFRVERFTKAMQAISSNPSMRIALLNDLFDWNSLGEGTIVDIGGSRGHISFELLEKHPKLKAIVQDLPEVEPTFNPPAALKDRVSFQVHDFFTPEPVKNASVYFMKHILHDWSDPWSVKILKNIVPAMGPDSRILLAEFIVPPPGTPIPKAALGMVYGADMHMGVMVNSLERTPEDWEKLVKMADERLTLKKCHTSPGSGLGIVEIVLAQ